MWQSIRPGVTQAPPSASTFLGAKARELGALADAHDLAVGDPDRAILDQPERIARALLDGRDVAVDEQPVPHDLRLRRALVATVKAMSGLAEPFRAVWSTTTRRRRSGCVGAPLAAGSVTPGACDLAPALLRQTLKRIGRYDVETGRELSRQSATAATSSSPA